MGGRCLVRRLGASSGGGGDMGLLNSDQWTALGLLGAGMSKKNFAGGAVAGMQYLDEAPMRQAKMGLLQTQLQAAQQQMEERQRQQAFLQNLPDPTFAAGQSALAGGGGPTLENAARVPQVNPMHNLMFQAVKAGAVPFADYLKTMTPTERINKLDAKDFTPASVQKFNQTGNYADLVRLDKLHFADTGGRVAGLNPFTGAEVGSVEKTGNPYNDLVLGDGKGGMRPNTPLISAKSQVAKAGASNTNISVNTEKNLLNEIAGGFGKEMVSAKSGAQGALGTISTVNRLFDALDSGKVMAGPGTTFRQYGLQVGNILGVGGKDAQEKLLNTRQAIQSLAQLELDAAQQMKGQGQITEAERSIIRRAASGDIDGMTAQELRLLGGVLDRTARSKIRNYNSQVKPLASNPNAAPLAPFLNVEEPPERPGSGGMRRFNPATGKIE